MAIVDGSVDGWYKIAYNGDTGYVSADYLNVDKDNIFSTYGRINASGVIVRSGASTESKGLATIDEDAIVTVNGLVDGWYDVTCEYGTEGYIRSDYVDLTEYASSNGDIVDTAMAHLGTRYVYGGALPQRFRLLRLHHVCVRPVRLRAAPHRHRPVAERPGHPGVLHL